MDFSSYSCKICEWDDEGTQISSYTRPITLTHEEADSEGLKTGVCDFEIRTSVEETPDSFSKCAIMGDNKNWKPSLGLDGRFCQCWQPEHTTIRSHIEVTDEQYSRALLQHEVKEQAKPAEDGERTEITQIVQDDFVKGTYRITQSGTYLVMEDIVLNFNPAPEGHGSPNNYDDNFWWPTSDQSDEYPGAMDARDAYFLGFFAGITIEADDVVLDLQGHEIKMAPSFYYQQPYFSIIELESQPFLPQQGPGFFGSDPVFPSNVVIRNGVLGLSSHHAIHGNWNDDITIESLRVRDFQTHGIQLNGFNRLEVRDCDIGPSTKIAYLNGNYAHMRLIMPTLKKVAEDSDTADPNTILFMGRDKSVTMWDLIDKLVIEMDMAYEFAVSGKVGSGELWEEAVEMFVNPSGLSMGAVMYGLFLNYPSAGIFGWHVNDQLSYNATVENVVIHDLRHRGIEVVGFQSAGRVFCNAFNGPLPAYDVFGADNVMDLQMALDYDDDKEVNAVYVGSVISDIHIAQYFWGKDDFDFWPGIPYLGAHDKLLQWATGTNDSYIKDNRNIIDFACNEDAMFHPSKGLIAVKASGVKGLKMNNVKVQRIQDETPLGSDLCGHKDKYHFSQQTPYQIGYSMNMVMGITMDFVTESSLTDTTIEYLSSDTGLTFGLAAWFESDITLSGALSIKEITAGVGIDEDQFSYHSRPNKAPESCSMRFYDDVTYPLSMTYADDLVLSQQCMKGAVGCLGTDSYTKYSSVEAAGDCTNDYVFSIAPGSVEEVLAENEQRSMQMVEDRALRTSVFDNKVVDVSFIAGCIAFVAVVLLLKLRFLWCPAADEKGTEVTPLMAGDRQIYE